MDEMQTAKELVKFFADVCRSTDEATYHERASTSKRPRKDLSHDLFDDGLIVYDMLKHLQPALKRRGLTGEEVIQMATRFEKLFSPNVIQNLITRHENPEEMLDVMLLL